MTALKANRQAQANRRTGGGRGLLVGVIGYLCVSLQQPLGWTIPVWGFFAFLLVPCLVGIAVGRSQKTARTTARAFWTAAKSGGTAMGLYTAVHLLLIGGPHSDGANSGQEFLAGLLTLFAFSLIAGFAAGAVSAAVVGVGAKERQS